MKTKVFPFGLVALLVIVVLLSILVLLLHEQLLWGATDGMYSRYMMSNGPQEEEELLLISAAKQAEVGNYRSVAKHVDYMLEKDPNILPVFQRNLEWSRKISQVSIEEEGVYPWELYPFALRLMALEIRVNRTLGRPR